MVMTFQHGQGDRGQGDGGMWGWWVQQGCGEEGEEIKIKKLLFFLGGGTADSVSKIFYFEKTPV